MVTGVLLSLCCNFSLAQHRNRTRPNVPGGGCGGGGPSGGDLCGRANGIHELLNKGIFVI